MGIGGVALTWLLQREGLLAKPVKPEFAAHDLLPKRPPHEPRAKAMISLFMQGGPSQMDLCDPKPMLDEVGWQGHPGETQVRRRSRGQRPGAAQFLEIQQARTKRHGLLGTAARLRRDCR